MVQIIPRIPTAWERFGENISQGLGDYMKNTASQMQQMKQQKQQQMQMEQENQALKQLGIDLTGISDPKQRQQYVAAALQGANQRELEMFKQQGREQATQQKQEFLGQLMGGGQTQNREEQEQAQGGEKYDPANFTDAQIAQAATIDPNLARIMQSQKDVALREKREEEKRQFEMGKEERKREHEISKVRRKEETEISKPILLELNEARKNIPLQEQAIEDIQNAAGDVSALDYLADVTGFEPLRSASGAKMKTAIKDFFLSDLTRAGSRPNRWIEEQLADALPKIGRSKEANLIVAEGMKFKVDLAKKRIEILDDLAEEDRENFGYVKANIDARAAKEMKKYVIDRQHQLKQNIEKIKKPPAKGQSKTVRIRSPEGEILEIDRNDLEEAKQHGYQLTG